MQQVAPPTGHKISKMEEKLTKLNAKLALLHLTRGKTDGIVGTGNVEKIRQKKVHGRPLLVAQKSLKEKLKRPNWKTEKAYTR